MTLIKLGNIIDDKATVLAQVFEPGVLPDEELVNWINVGEIPSPEVLAGKIPILFYNVATKTLEYEYIDRTLTIEEEVEQLRIDLGNSLFENAMDKTKIANLEANQGEMLMEIAMIKMGGIL